MIPNITAPASCLDLLLFILLKYFEGGVVEDADEGGVAILIWSFAQRLRILRLSETSRKRTIHSLGLYLQIFDLFALRFALILLFFYGLVIIRYFRGACGHFALHIFQNHAVALLDDVVVSVRCVMVGFAAHATLYHQRRQRGLTHLLQRLLPLLLFQIHFRYRFDEAVGLHF